MHEVIQEFTIIFEIAPEGGYTASIPEVPGAISEGETLEECREMVIDAMHEILAYRREQALEQTAPGDTVETFALSA